MTLYCKLRVAGYFVWDIIISSEEAKEIIKQEVAEIIFSFMRAYLYNLMQNAGMSPFILPIEYFASDLNSRKYDEEKFESFDFIEINGNHLVCCLQKRNMTRNRKAVF